MELEIRQQYIIKASMTMLFLKGNSDKNYFYLFARFFIPFFEGPRNFHGVKS